MQPLWVFNFYAGGSETYSKGVSLKGGGKGHRVQYHASIQSPDLSVREWQDKVKN